VTPTAQSAAKRLIKLKKGTKIPDKVHLIKVDRRKYFYWLLPFKRDDQTKFGLTVQTFEHDEKGKACEMRRKQFFFPTLAATLTHMTTLVEKKLNEGFAKWDKRVGTRGW
jgi:hypothetical protein